MRKLFTIFQQHTATSDRYFNANSLPAFSLSLSHSHFFSSFQSLAIASYAFYFLFIQLIHCIEASLTFSLLSIVFDHSLSYNDQDFVYKSWLRVSTQVLHRTEMFNIFYGIYDSDRLPSSRQQE
jgi:hypothetical protein